MKQGLVTSYGDIITGGAVDTGKVETYSNVRRRYIRVYHYGTYAGAMVQGRDRVWRSDDRLSGRFGTTITGGTLVATAREAVQRAHRRQQQVLAA